MRALRWIAVVPPVLGLLFVLVALLWTEWPQFFVGVLLVVAGAALWRVIGGSWEVQSS